MSYPCNRIDLDSSGGIDDVVLRDVDLFRLERMTSDTVWVKVYLKDGTAHTFNLSADPNAGLCIAYEKE